MTRDAQNPVPGVATVRARDSIWPIGMMVVAAGGWIGLALRSPTTTWHLGPVVISAVPPITARIRSDRPLTLSGGRLLTLAGLIATLTVAIVLQLAGKLAGPTVIDRGSAFTETLLLASLAAIWSYRAATRSKPPWWLRVMGSSTP